MRLRPAIREAGLALLTINRTRQTPSRQVVSQEVPTQEVPARERRGQGAALPVGLAEKHADDPVAGVPLRIAALIAEKARAGRPLLVSDENLIGTSQELIRKRALYPTLERRLRILRDALPDAPIRIALAVRSYDSFFESAYCEQLRHRSGPSFDAIAPDLFAQTRGWREIVGEISAIFGRTALRLWRFEDYRDGADRVLEALLGPRVRIEAPTVSEERPRISDEAVREIERLPHDLPLEERRARCREIIARLPRPEHPAFDGWSKERRAALRARYDQDVAALVQERPDAWLIPPPPQTRS
ncbi:MAG: hypothetical protein AAFW46_00365 [Pseudomonadota bacterium]